MRKITIIDGHPDPSHRRLNHALADRYAGAAMELGNEVRRIDVARLDFELLRRPEDFYDAEGLADEIALAQRDLAWADHLAIFYPLWLSDMPALLKAFLEQTMRPGFALEPAGRMRFPRPLLVGKTARIVLTMGMPRGVYRWYFGAHSLKSFARTLAMTGIAPIANTLIGAADEVSDRRAARLFKRVRRLAVRDTRGLKRSRRARNIALAGAAFGIAGTAAAAFALWSRYYAPVAAEEQVSVEVEYTPLTAEWNGVNDGEPEEPVLAGE